MVIAFHFSMGDFTDGRVKYLRTMQLRLLFMFEKKKIKFISSLLWDNKSVLTYTYLHLTSGRRLKNDEKKTNRIGLDLSFNF